MPTKTGDKVRIIVLGTGPDAETARLIAESDADVALAAKFTKTVTHLVIDDTVKPTEARVKKAEEAGVPVLTFDQFKALLVAGPEDEVDQAVEAELEEAPAETPAAVVDTEAAESAVVEAEIVDEDAAPAAAAEHEVEAGEPETVKVEEPEPVADPEPAAEAETPAEPEPKAEPVAEAIDEPEEPGADPEKAVPSQADAPAIESDEKSDKAKPGLIAKIKSIFNLTGSRR